MGSDDDAMDEDTRESTASPSTSRDAAFSPAPSEKIASTSESASGAHTHTKTTPASVNSGPTASGSKAKEDSQPHSKRRRGLGVVTANACTECRKKRAKCDGQKPCGRCKFQKDVECVYEIPVRQSKEDLRTELESLRYRQRSSDHVIAALVRPQLWEEVLTRLRGGQTVENISDWLGKEPPGAAGQLPTLPAQPGDSTANIVGTGASLPPTTDFGPGSGGIPGSMGALGSGSGRPSGSSQPQQQSQQSQQQNQQTQQPQQSQQQQPPSGLRSGELRGNSPWHFSSQSQAGSTRSSSLHETVNWTPEPQRPPQFRVGSWAENMNRTDQGGSEELPRFRGLEQVLSPLNEPEMKTPAGTWTNITDDINLVQHLLALYFCWEYPTFASLSKEHFLRDFQDGRHRYCSPMLINALLALGCRFSTQPMTRANPNDPYTSGDHFFKESQRLFYLETDHHNLTTIQALGIMSIREASCGRDSESWYFAGQSVRLAVEMGLHRIHDEGDEDELAVQSATFWGAFALDHAWSLATGSLPQCSCFPHLPPKPAIIGDIEASLWVPYTDDGAPLQRSCEQPSNVRSVYKCFCELSELVHQSLYILHSPGNPLTARDLLNIYTQYLNWYDQIPEVLRLGHNFTPAVLFAHLYYHFAILLLFRPLIKLRILGSKITPRDVCSQAADAIQGLLRSYSQLYTLRRTPSFVPYFVLTSVIMHLAIGGATVSAYSETSEKESIQTAIKLDPHISQAINQGIADLAEMAPCHHFAEQALNILRFLAKKWNIDVDVDKGQPPPADFDRLVRPNTSSLNFFAPDVQTDDMMCLWGVDSGGKTMEPRDERQQPEIGDLDKVDNPLFWPFPMQGRPILPRTENLEAAGFALL